MKKKNLAFVLRYGGVCGRDGEGRRFSFGLKLREMIGGKGEGGGDPWKGIYAAENKVCCAPEIFFLLECGQA